MDEHFKIPSANLSSSVIYRKPVAKTSTAEVSKEIEENKTEIASINLNTDRKAETPSPNLQKPIPNKFQPKCTYVEPKWSQKPSPEHQYHVEVLKNGTIVEQINNLQSKAYWLIGKLQENDLQMAHPTISRYHAVLQYRPEVAAKTESGDEDDESPTIAKKSDIEKGWYLYDLNSTHGSFVNKMKIPPKTYVRVRVGYMMKFGASTRCFILQGPDFDEEAESEMTVTELIERKKQQKLAEIEQVAFQEKQREADGISWGMSEDADEETDLTVNPYASTNNEELFLADPKKTLRGYFEREGLDLEYKVDEMSAGTFVCRIELPVTDSNGRTISAEICHKGKKKDCVIQGALEACRILDRHGVLRQANHEPRKRKIENSDSDDDDDFYDRTGDVERKRQQKAANSQKNALSYEELLKQQTELNEKLMEIEAKIEKFRSIEKTAKENAENDDDLDDFMSKLSKDTNVDKTEIRKLKVEMQTIKNDKKKLEKLINIARPIDLPPLQLNKENNVEVRDARKKFQLPLFGKRGTFKFSSTTVTAKKEVIPVVAGPSSSATEYKSDEEEMEDVDENVEKIVKLESSEVQKSENLGKSEVKRETVKEENQKKIEIDSDLMKMDPKDDDKLKSGISVDSEKSHGSYKREQSTEDDQNDSASVKKRRSRIRIRNDRGRDNVDINDAEEAIDITKYSTWIPPENQCGDGSTNLNAKYGY